MMSVRLAASKTLNTRIFPGTVSIVHANRLRNGGNYSALPIHTNFKDLDCVFKGHSGVKQLKLKVVFLGCFVSE